MWRVTKACPHENGGMLSFLNVDLVSNFVFFVVNFSGLYREKQKGGDTEQ